jgi:beta-glucosidase
MVGKMNRVALGACATALAGALLALVAEASAGEQAKAPQGQGPKAALTQYTDWPRIQSEIARDSAMEAEIARIVAGMSLAQKVGQMTLAEIKSVTPAQVRQYYIGAVLNGGGSFPGNNKHAAAADWVNLADAYWQASMSSDAQVKIPVIWGTDAVHGHGNVFGATLFPHNIGLGATRDKNLIRHIGQAVAQQVAATGIDWTFAPTLAVVRDDRWGRTYESFSEDPALVHQYGYEYVKGLQGDFESGRNVIATAKHFIGDGGTDQGKDQGINMASELEMINLHGQGYYSALRAGAQTVMASFHSWNNDSLGIQIGKMHGSKTMLTDILKGKMGFDGFVLGDWNGHGQVPGCNDGSCAQAINAGVDLIMVPDQWQAFIGNTIAQVGRGEIAIERINDAVTRILRVKMRAGLFAARRPAERANAANVAQLEQRQLAREAVQKSLVLLKNNDQALPLSRTGKYLVVGKSADSIANQSGGWSLTWQGTGNTNADFPHADSILTAIKATVGEANVVYSATGAGINVQGFKAVIAVIGETPYAEGVGDIGKTGTLEHARRYPEDLAALNNVSGKGIPVVTVLLAGRPLWVNRELNRSEAFVMAWLPGSEGKGVTDVLFRTANGHVNSPFTGKLSFSWPKSACQTPLNLGDAEFDPLFAYGYGLSYDDEEKIGLLDESAPTLGCGQSGPTGPGATVDLDIFRSTDQPPFATYIGSPENWGGTALGSDLNAVISHANIKAETGQVNVQQDAKKVTWNAIGQFYAQAAQTSDQQSYLAANAALVFDTIVHQAPAGLVKVRVDCQYPCIGEVDGTTLFNSFGINSKHTAKIPLACFAAKGTDFATINTPILVFTDKAFSASFANIRWVPGAANDADAAHCDALVPPAIPASPPLPGPEYALFANGVFNGGYRANTYSTNNSHASVSVLPSGELAMNFAADGADGLVYFSDGNSLNLSNFVGGNLSFEVLVQDYGSNSQGLVIKIESSGTNCNTGDVAIGRPASGNWQTISLPLAQVAGAASGCFNWQNINVPFGILPKWGDQQGVKMQVRNIRFVQ